MIRTICEACSTFTFSRAHLLLPCNCNNLGCLMLSKTFKIAANSAEKSSFTQEKYLLTITHRRSTIHTIFKRVVRLHLHVVTYLPYNCNNFVCLVLSKTFKIAANSTEKLAFTQENYFTTNTHHNTMTCACFQA